MPNILITGNPGCGKSTLMVELIKEIRPRKRVAGIITPEIKKGGKRYGFKIIDLASGQEEMLASVDIKPAVISKYGINIKGIDKIIDKFLESFENAEVVFIDEIGKMEFYSEKFREAMEKVFASDKTVVAVLHRSFAEKYKNKGKVIWLERGKINIVKELILEKIK